MSKTTSNNVIGILGGTFDPVHLGHLHIATKLLAQFPLKEIRFIPCKQPLLKAPAHASSTHRLAMLHLALDTVEHVTIDERELNRPAPSYMLDTLQSIRNEEGDSPLCLILGMDAFAKFNDWHRWQEILSVCHLLIVNRPSNTPPDHPQLQAFIQQHQTTDKHALSQHPHGSLLFTNIPSTDISSTRIRSDTHLGQLNDKQVPKAVADYIQTHHLYNTQ